MSYTTQELSLQLPGKDLQDSTINILRLNDLGTSLVITRGALGDGETLRSHTLGVERSRISVPT